ncbi:hypothetical protein EV44_g3076 [Erysiphe necator]|uniref:Uncharacterized protein n=1 Tax=Uncinula necator TaxID=52586 RepID=A0A0B1P3S0_UNCNE|nr:hypothetical protein EV44_g3076 [Erysiphe necator]
MSESKTSPQLNQTCPKPLKRHRQKLLKEPSLYFTSKYWDRLPRPHLTKNALKELNYRNRQLESPISTPQTYPELSPDLLEALRQIAREGGPDLTDLRGFPEPFDDTMESYEQGQSSRSTLWTRPSGTVRKTKTTGPYDRDFASILEASGIYSDPYIGPEKPFSIVPTNINEMIERADQPRASVSAETYQESRFQKFRRVIAYANFETEVVASVVPTLEAENGSEKLENSNITFSNLAPLIDGGLDHIVLSKTSPDLFYGSSFECLDERIRQNLSSQVLPKLDIEKPIAPNFFLELKGPEGHQRVADRQALYNGALGERGQIALRSWGHDHPVLDGAAHTITCTFISGALTFYSIHAVPVETPSRRIEYFMYLIGIYVMHASASQYRKGIAAYQNLREYAEEKRNESISLANSRL